VTIETFLVESSLSGVARYHIFNMEAFLGHTNVPSRRGKLLAF